ncbi:MAG: alpha/beta fold hydrolase [Anaerolineae bacterium]|nr:alpha/beta fold hydrolase [Anaerolineae bacterium]
MTTKPVFPSSRPIQTEVRTPTGGGVLRRIGLAVLALIGIIVALILALPVPLLFFATSVPVLIAIALAAADIGIVIALFRLERTPVVIAAAFAGIVIVSILAIWLSQMFASTPPITGADGNVLPGSIAEMTTVDLNGSEQWITIRGHNLDNPVLLFLAGGPGGSELVMTRRYLGDLEKHFIVVNWDQPGTGKSYNAVAIDELTPERYVDDGIALTNYLRERFDQDRIYILGESWGSILGIWMAQQHPELYYAFVGTGQMVTTTENDVLGYEFDLDYLAQRGETEAIERLRQIGPPPYSGSDMMWRYMDVFGVQNGYMNAHAHGEDVNHNLMFDSLLAPEYGLVDKVNWLRGLIDVFVNVYPQIADLDFRTQAAQLSVPVYIIKGRWDVNAMNSLVEDYFAILDAPHKELIWFEDSAHTPLWDSPRHFVEVMVDTVMAQTRPECCHGRRP